jgi:hypothetical protein
MSVLYVPVLHCEICCFGGRGGCLLMGERMMMMMM